MKNLLHSSACIASCLLATAATALAQTMVGTDPVKIFILAGESNMHGKGTVSPATTQGTLDYIVANDPTGKYQFLKSGGNYVTRTDVGIRGLVFSGTPNPGNLTINYGGFATGLIGPELGFGHKLGDAYENKVLIVKVGVDGTTLGGSFCPPSSRVGEPEPVVSTDKGFYYKEIIRLVNEAKTALGATPHEIAGLGWHQGWNDRVNAAYSAAYETNMANFINDIRSGDKGLGVPNMPFVIASAAMDPGISYSEVELAQLKMANPTAYPAFAGNVATVDTRTKYEDLEFWQSVATSPADEGYHWNRSGKTFLHIGLAMGDAMSLIAPNRIPCRLRSSGGPGGTTLTWKNGTETPTSVRVLRNGLEIAASAPANLATFVDSSPPLGVSNYELQFTMPGNPAIPLTISQNSGVTNLVARLKVNGAHLSWQNNLGYVGLTVKRDGVVIAASLPGSTTSYVDIMPPAGVLSYTVEPTTAGSTPAQASLKVSAIPAQTAVIYEPFDMTAGTLLDGQKGGLGLDGDWVGGSLGVTAGNLAFGTLPTYGNRLLRGGGNGNCFIKTGTTLTDAGLLADGAVLWFSFLHREPDGNINTQPALILGNGNLEGYFNDISGTSSGIGVRVGGGKSPQPILFNAGVYSEGAVQSTIGTSQVALIVGKITWGATPGAPDTIQIYTPGTDLVLDTPTSNSAVLDQANFNLISMWGNGGAPEFDEIRFGASYVDVTGQGVNTSGDFTAPTPATMSFASVPAATSTSSITMTATTATDANSVQYRFLETSGNPGGTSSAWQDNATYTDTGLNPNTQYTYTVQARDKSVNNNTNTTSSPASATTFPPDITPPPTPGFETAPNATSFSTITMTATTVADPEGGAVEYYFTETSGNPGGTSSGWQSSPTYTDTGLNPNTQYTYTVKARDTASPPNESAPSAPASATTPVKTPTTYIRQNNTSLLNTTGAWDVGDLPLGVDSVQWDATCASNRSTALGGDVTWGKIIIATGTAGAVTIGNTAGARISLNGVGGTGIDMSATPFDLTINNLMTLGSSQTWNVITSRILTVGNYAIGDGGAGYGITKAGAGTVALQGSNTFTGPITITGGTVSINSIANGGAASPLGQSSSAASNLLLGNGTTLTYTGGAASSDRSFTINGTAAAHGATINANSTGALNLTSTSAIGYGTLDQTRTLTLSGANNLANTHVLAAQITNNGSGAVTLAKTGTGSVWHLTNPNNSFTGGVTFNRGFLVFSSGALGTTGKIAIGANTLPPFGLRWAPGNTDDISSRFNDTGTSAQCTLDTGANDVVFASEIAMRADSWLIKNGSGSLTLNTASGWGTGSNAATLINAGTLVAKVLANGGTKSSVGNTSNNAFALGLRGGVLKYTGTGATTDHNFHLSGNNTLDASGTGALVFSQTGVISPTPAARVFPLTLNSTSTGNATVTSADLVPGMTVGGTGIQAGTKIVSIGINGSLTFDKTTTAATGNQTLSFGSYPTGTLTLTGNNTGANEIKGILKDSVSNIDASSTTLAITKTGAGKWVLSGANTYTGATTLSGGTLALGANNVLPNGSAFTLGAATLDAATFTDTLGTLDVTDSATINLGAGGTLAFAASHSINSGTWSGTLNITGTLGTTSIRFGSASNALTASQLSKITVNGTGTYTLDSNGYLVAGASSAYDTWETANAPGSNPDDDTDGDGVRNAVEFVLGGTSATKDLDKLPAISASGNDMLFTFYRKQSSIDPKTIVTIEVGTNLLTWPAPSSYNVPDGASANNPGVTVVKGVPANFDTITLRVPKSPDAKKFARLKVVVSP